MSIRVLGNPSVAETVSVEVRGAAGQPLRIRVLDNRGDGVSETNVEQAASLERATLRVGRPGGFTCCKQSHPHKSKLLSW